MPGKVPERWEDYSPYGSVIPGTRFIACKVPLDDDITCKLSSEDLVFTPNDLISQLKDGGSRLGLVIDLTNTKRYYNPKRSLFKNSVQHRKIFTEGHVVPSLEVQQSFADTVNEFLARNKRNNHVIAVHCTHGVNRTGYLICRYMISEMEMDAEEAIKIFNKSRGHQLERENYLQDLKTSKHKMKAPTPHLSQRHQERHSYNDWRSGEGWRSSRGGNSWRHNQSSQEQHYQEWNDSDHYHQDNGQYWQHNQYRSHGYDHPTSWREPQSDRRWSPYIHPGHRSDSWRSNNKDGYHNKRR
ncbi:hypothetical protein CAPTEDRAFT_220933 [Capitella teleta]|uniref:Uncharacterized protein n=1 Tax=Capitella teleta TaxID=283909 RepID=R7TYH5_CAPTE|nr:hypothetical protein CAPTEDRAFT_220933 [Capitella teleta]|eukprot:ELT98784.1 hypothetical protein CAPTEDRAFT_220933 [Capitella teleta]